MTDLWAYYPPICDGDFCPMNCDICGKHDEAMAADPKWSKDDE